MHDTSVRNAPLRQLRGLIALLRPKQWIKNGFVLVPLIFTGAFLDLQAVRHAWLAVLFFCIASSAVYIVNDINDVEQDRQHPKKSKTRPLAAGTVSVPMALALLAVLYALLFAGWFLMPRVLQIIAAYVALNVSYTFALKQEPVIDIFTVALGFVLRVYAGAKALEVPVSGWMFVTTLCLTLYMAAVKRRQELSQNGSDGREVLKKYSVALVERYAEMAATGALVFYSMFVMSARPELLFTVPLVLFGLFRYWYVVEQTDGGESPTDVLLADWQLLLTVIAWIGTCGWALWPGRA